MGTSGDSKVNMNKFQLITILSSVVCLTQSQLSFGKGGSGSSSSQESVQTKEPGSNISLMRGLSLPSAAVAASAVASTKKGAQEPGVRLPVVRLSLASAAGVVVVVIAAVQSSAENSAAKETSAHSEDAPVNKAVTSAYDSLISVRLCVSISVRC